VTNFSKKIPLARDSTPDDPRSYWDRLLMEEQAERDRSRRSLVGVDHEVRTREGWKGSVDVHPWQGVPYPLEPSIGRIPYTRPLDLIDQAKQCWVDRRSLDFRDVDVSTALEAGAKGAVRDALKDGAKAGAVGWIGGGTEAPAVAAGAAWGGAKGFVKGTAKSALGQMCRKK